MRKNILFICGSLNQTTMMHDISRYLYDFNSYFTPYYANGIVGFFSRTPILNFSILGGQFRKSTTDYILSNNLNLDFGGRSRHYDLVITCSDLIIPTNILGSRIILVQEGMTDPENFMFHLVKTFKFPRWLASTSATGLSMAYNYFCVASHGYKDFFIKKGVNPETIVVTGIPNFDDCQKYVNNDFRFKGYVLAATSDSRETYKFENRKKFIKKVNDIASGKQIIFKLHPNELYERAAEEINRWSPGAIIFKEGNTEHMIANCSVLVTRYSSCAYVGLALGKDVHSAFEIDELKRLLPDQNGGKSAYNIAAVARSLIAEIAPQTFVKQKYYYKYIAPKRSVIIK
ncbi:MAG: hypothetical protein P4L27_11765 [Ignavibacteriaceae bacterium]|nr:hypothetical protein [Ignavibacteriaceae bacterium]